MSKELSQEYFDFRYLQKTPPHVQGIAVFYEYARHSAALVERVYALRRAGFLSSSPSDDEAIREHAFEQRALVRIGEIALLVRCEMFPDKSFFRVMQEPSLSSQIADLQFGVQRVSYLVRK